MTNLNHLFRGALGGAALAFSWMSAPVSASPDLPTGSWVHAAEQRLEPPTSPLDAEQSRPAIHAHLFCSFSLDPRGAREVALLPYYSHEQLKAVSTLMTRRSVVTNARDRKCFSKLGNAQVGFDVATAVGAFSEILIKKNYGGDDVARIDKLTPEDWSYSGLTPRNGSETFAMCVVQSKGLLVYLLMDSEPASDAEMTAISDLAPSFGPCLMDGVQLSFDAASLRSMLAHSLYRVLSQMDALAKERS